MYLLATLSFCTDIYVYLLPGYNSSPQDALEGAQPPFVIHADGSKTTYVNYDRLLERKEGPNECIFVSEDYCDGLAPASAESFVGSSYEEDKRNPFGFCVRHNSSGSMTQETFYDYAVHFVRHLPESQGKGGEPVILFLDGHGSRWNVAALRYLMANNVFPFFLPSHTSVWSQPNDSGVNKRLHACLECSTKSMQRMSIKSTLFHVNTII